MKNIKKNWAIALVLSLTLAASSLASPVTAYADTSITASAIVKAPLENGKLLVTVNDMEIALTISAETLVISNKTGQPASLEDLKANDRIFAYYSAAMTKSLPAQSHAIAIVTEVEKDKSHAQLFTVKEIISRNAGEVRALNQEGDLVVSITKETPFSPFKTKQMVSLDDITVGTQLFIWYDVVALSYPGQTGATKAVLVGQSMVPLRTVAEELGFKVTWNATDRSVSLDDGTVKTTIHIGNDSYFKASSQAIGLTRAISLGAAPVIVDGRTYVPAALFDLLSGDYKGI